MSDVDTDPVGSRPLTSLRGVGSAMAQKLAKLGLHRVSDLLFHLPTRYEDRTRITQMGRLRPGTRAVVEGEVALTDVVFRGRRSLLSRIADGTGSVTLRLFHFSRQQQAGLARGERVRAYGEVRAGRQGLEMIHPEYRILRDGEDGVLEDRLTPIYPVTEGVTQARIRGLIEQALSLTRGSGAPDLLRDAVPGLGEMPDLMDALEQLHRPPRDADLAALSDGAHPAQRRLVLEELLAHHLSLQRLRAERRTEPARPLPEAEALRAALLDELPFDLTGAQQRVIGEIDEDLSSDRPMMRLVQGDVGSGKTVVAAAAMLRAMKAGRQAAMMAPTELLAEQHFENMKGWLEPLGIVVGWLSGRQRAAERRAAAEAIEDGRIQVAVGTHALFQAGVVFDDLALVVVDEQHRFGVHQRLALREKGRRGAELPHQLIMTATPIPRTLAQTAYADLDVSIIDELPPGREPVITVAMRDNKRADVVERIRVAIGEGRQVYWVCPLVEESELLEAQAAEATAQQLSEALPEVEVGLVHGRMKPQEKDSAMRAFKDGRTRLLVATTVIEVGVDVPAASLMVIENAERMGLSQLHQLRGRVGRGAISSSCVLLYRPPLSEHGRARLEAMRETHSGFEIASRDLELRGPGELLGTRQTGLMQMRVADLVRDGALLPEVRTAAAAIDPDSETAAALIARWVGERDRYAQV